MRLILAFIMHRGRMSCSAAAGAIATEPIHRSELTRFLARPRWQKHDFNKPLMQMLLAKEKKKGKFIFIIDATLVSQAGKRTQNTFSTGNRNRREIKKGFRYNKKKVVRKACQEKGYTWIFPANAERVYEGSTGKRPQLRSRLKDWKSLSLKTIRLRASAGKYADYRRLSKWRVGPKTKPRVYYAYQEKRAVRNVGDVQLVFSTMKPDLEKATPDDVKILMTNATGLSLSEVLELYSLRWQIELFFKELKSTLGFSQYSFIDFNAVNAWVKIAITTVLYLEHERIVHMLDRRLGEERRQWWQRQRLHGLCHAVRLASEHEQLKYIEKRTKTSGGLKKLQRLLSIAIPQEYRVAA